MTHICPIPSCTWSVADDKLMCATHWRLVPAGTQRLVYQAFRAIPAARSTPARIAAHRAHREACDAAIAAVTRTLGPLL